MASCIIEHEGIMQAATSSVGDQAKLITRGLHVNVHTGKSGLSFASL